jgi:hypothetical protein
MSRLAAQEIGAAKLRKISRPTIASSSKPRNIRMKIKTNVKAGGARNWGG